MMPSRPATSLPCAYCQLPVPVYSENSPETTFCCYGCRLASEITQGTGDDAVIRWMLVRIGTAVFLTLNLMAFSMALWTPDIYGVQMENRGMEQAYTDLFRYLSLIVSTPVILTLGPPLARSAVAGVVAGRPGTDLLVIIGVLAAFVASAYAVFAETGPIYFEVSCVVLIFVTLGRWLEASGKLHARKAMDDLTQLMPTEAVLIKDGIAEVVDVSEVQTGDLMQLRPGDRVACDVTLRDGELSLDEQILTGESRPVLKTSGSRILSGTLILEGNGVASVISPYHESTVAKLIEHVQTARERKGHYARLADRVAEWMLPVVIPLALIAGLWHQNHGGFHHGLLVSLSVLLIACPCALGLATPLAVWSAMGNAAKRGILFSDGETLEKLAKIDTVFFDKTGTLTTGHPKLVRSVSRIGSVLGALPDDSEEFRWFLERLISGSGHPLARCLRTWLNQENHRLASSEQSLNHPGHEKIRLRTRPGRGMIAYSDGDVENPIALLGNPALIQETGLKLSRHISDALETAIRTGHSVMIFAMTADSDCQVLFEFDESLRPDVQSALTQLSLSNPSPQLAILTGDHRQAAEKLAGQLGVAVFSELLPEEKLAIVQRYQKQGHCVAFVGEGYNDAPAMVAADVGIALGSGADLTRDNASVCIMGNQLCAVPFAIDLARKTVRRIRRNLFWAFFYNMIGLILAMIGWLNPTIAAAIMFVSSIAVVSGSWNSFDKQAAEDRFSDSERKCLPQPI